MAGDADVGDADGDGHGALRAAAAHYYEACLLHEDESLDPGDHDAVLRAAFGSSNCDDFARILAEATGWPAMRLSWITRDGDFGHHALVRGPDGRLLDVAGWTDRAGLERRYRTRDAALVEAAPISQSLGFWVDEDGIDEEAGRILAVIRAMTHAPYGEPWFRDLTGRPVPGADTAVEAPPAAGGP